MSTTTTFPILKPLPAYTPDSKFQTDIELGLLPGSQTPADAALNVAPEQTPATRKARKRCDGFSICKWIIDVLIVAVFLAFLGLLIAGIVRAVQGTKKLNGELVKLAEMARKLVGVKERMHQAVLDAQKWREFNGVPAGAEGMEVEGVGF